MKTSKCDECKHCKGDDIGNIDVSLMCGKGHKPRFYKQKHDMSCGYKRKCEDFEGKNESSNEL